MIKKFAIHGVPRTGSTWIGELFNSSPHVCYRFQPLFSYALKSYLTESSSSDEVTSFYDELFVNQDAFLSQSAARLSGKLPCFEKDVITHVGYKEVRCHNILPNLLRVTNTVKFLFIIRNPFSVINSWLNAPREFRADLHWIPQEEWRYAPKKNLDRPEEFNGYERWKEATLMFYHLKVQHPNQVMLLNYDDLLNNTVESAKKAYQFLELEYTHQTEEFIASDSQNSKDPYSVMRSDQSDEKWKTQLDPIIVNAIKNDLTNTGLEHFLA